MTVEDLSVFAEALVQTGLQAVRSVVPESVWFAFGGLAALVIGMLWLLYRTIESVTEQRKLLGEAMLEFGEVRRQLVLLEAQRAGVRFTQLEEQVAALGKGQEQLMLSDSTTASYLQAIRHAQRGAGIEELMRTHDLARAEAELILTLHAGLGRDREDTLVDESG